MADRTWQRVAAYVVCRDAEGRVLLTRYHSPESPDSGKWTMPGGGMEWGERPAQTAVRELAEETGYHAQIGPILGVYSEWLEAHETVSGEAGLVVGVIYEATGLTGELRTTFDEGTTDAAAWFWVEAARALPSGRVPLVAFVLDLIT